MKKALIFDCDNTLWQGVVGEGEIIPDTDIQSDIIFLANRGVIIGLCSKNNEEDVMDALKDQLLTEKVISVKRINWKDKASNLKEIAEELNIGLDAIVFVDDSEFEINLIKKELPAVMAIYPKDLMKTVIDNFNLTGDFTKTQQYKENYQRAKAQEQFSDINEYLASLDMVLTIKLNDKPQVARIAELTQKTNQFNLTNKRYDTWDINSLMECADVITLSVKDRFGDNGVVGICIIIDYRIDVFLLSCRIIGRGIEYAFMDYIVKNFKEIKHTDENIIKGSYVPSAKNQQVADFYSKLGFNFAENENLFTININDYKPHSKKHFRYEE